MTIRHLIIFLSVCEHMSFTKASKKLFIAQPSVSLAIKEMEEYYQMKLFDRIAKKIYLTQVGEYLRSYVAMIIDLYDEMDIKMKNFSAHTKLHIGASVTIGNYYLSKYITTFYPSYPDVNIEATIDNLEELESLLLSHTLDIALVEGMTHSEHIHSIPYMEDHLVIIASPNHPLSTKKHLHLHDIKEEAFILREKGSAGREIFDSTMLLAGIEITPIWQSSTTGAIVQGVKDGIGLSVLPYLLVKDELERKELIELHVEHISFKRNFSIAYLKNKFISNPLQAFIDMVKHTE